MHIKRKPLVLAVSMITATGPTLALAQETTQKADKNATETVVVTATILALTVTLKACADVR